MCPRGCASVPSFHIHVPLFTTFAFSGLCEHLALFFSLYLLCSSFPSPSPPSSTSSATCTHALLAERASGGNRRFHPGKKIEHLCRYKTSVLSTTSQVLLHLKPNRHVCDCQRRRQRLAWSKLLTKDLVYPLEYATQNTQNMWSSKLHTPLET